MNQGYSAPWSPHGDTTHNNINNLTVSCTNTVIKLPQTEAYIVILQEWPSKACATKPVQMDH